MERAAAITQTGTMAPMAGSAPAAPSARWYAVHSKPGSEALAAAHLAEQGFDPFLPRCPRTVRHARKVTTSLAPLFPRYLFVMLDPGRQHWRRINGTRGVARIVSFGEGPAPVPPGVVEALLELSDARGVVSADALLAPGRAVRLLAGPFADRIGLLARADGARAVSVLMDVMGREVEVRVPRDLVWPA